MAEGLSASEVGKELDEHARHGPAHEERDRLLSISEAVLLSVVALIAAWSGYSAAKWSTESRDGLAKASALRTQASRANLDALEFRNLDSSTFEAWFAAYIAKNAQAMAIAERRFRPVFRVAFDAWRATNPETNPTRRAARRTCRSTVSLSSCARDNSTAARRTRSPRARRPA